MREAEARVRHGMITILARNHNEKIDYMTPCLKGNRTARVGQ